MDFLKYKKIFFVLMVVILFGVAFVQKYPFGVKKYKTVSLGMQAFQSGGSKTYWAPPDDIVPESDFYIYSIGDEHMCIGSSCGMGGYFVECMAIYSRQCPTAGSVPIGGCTLLKAYHERLAQRLAAQAGDALLTPSPQTSSS
jgi:hypothetical protein